MTPEAVIYRYLELTSSTTGERGIFARLLCTDADLLNGWLRLLAIPAQYDTLLTHLNRLSQHEFTSLAPAQAWSGTTMGSTARLSSEQWQSVLHAAGLAEDLMEYLAARDGLTGSSSADVRMRALLALSGVQLENDHKLADLIQFRGTNPTLLEDAALEMRVFAVVDAIEVGRDADLAGLLLGIDRSDYSALFEQAERDVRTLVRELGVDVAADVDWAHRIWLRQHINVVCRSMSKSENLSQLVAAHELVSRGLFASPSIILLYDSVSDTIGEHPSSDLSISGRSKASLLASAIRVGERQTLTDANDVAVVDRQLLRRLESEEAVVQPLGQEKTVGLLVVGTDDDIDAEVSAEIYAEELSRAMQVITQADVDHDPEAMQNMVDVESLETITQHADNFRTIEMQRLRELVHEANNPLSIVNNYLHILGMQLQHEPEAVEKLDMISTELRRAEEIFARARQVPELPEVAVDPDDEEFNLAGLATAAEGQQTHFDVNEWLPRLTELYSGYASKHSVEMVYGAGAGAVMIETDQSKLAQILSNLVRNAIEASAADQAVRVRLQSGVYRQGVAGLEILIEDSGPGIAPEALEKLTEDKQSQKGGQHQGVGLKLCYALAAQIDAALDVQTRRAETQPDEGGQPPGARLAGRELARSQTSTGTTFSLFLPR